ncbi:MAG: hypothetical protein NTW19_11560 [Planctomycetota bacterium]|nr:hypothetical protein [Planctomycetota bacterium]
MSDFLSITPAFHRPGLIPALGDWSVSPREESRFLVQFTAAASPWWLLLLVPLAALLAWALYRRDWPALTRRSVVGLTLLRALLLVGLIVLAFRPNLVHRRTLTYPGRVAIVTDDSRSMTAHDDRLPDAEALRLARSLGLAPADQTAPYHAMADLAFALVAQLRDYERYARSADRASDAFWERAGQFQQDARQQLTRLDETASAARPVTLQGVPDAAEPLTRAQTHLAELRPALDALFVGDRGPGAKAFTDYFRQAEAFARECLALQARLDVARLAKGDKAMRDTADALRARTRLELLGVALGRASASLPPALRDQSVQLHSLTTGERRPLNDPRPLAPGGASTDIVSRLQAIADEPSDSPLSAVVLLTDGQDVAARPPAPVSASLSRQQTPLLAATLGADAEPTDVALVDLIAPPIAVVGRPVTLELVVKVAIDRPLDTRVEVTRDDQPVLAVPVKLTPAARLSIPVTLTPDKPGLFRYAVRVAPVSGEIFPTQNNAADFALNVRAEPLRVLLLDWKPRWETRFALNVLQRLPYVQLNTIIAVTRENQSLARGGERGCWPDSPATLSLYDLIILGDLPPDLLSDAEWDALRGWVADKGGSLCFLAPRTQTGLLPAAAVTRGLLPLVEPIASATRPATPTTSATAPDDELRRADQLRLTPAGLLHPLTLELADRVALASPQSLASISPRLRPAAQTLMLGPGDAPLVAFQGLGKGKTLLIDSDRLWMALNPTAHRAHLQMFLELATWAVEADAPQPGPRLALDRRRAPAGQGVQVWADASQAGGHVQAMVAGQSVGDAALVTDRPGSTLLRAAFPNLPVGAVTFRASSSRAEAGSETQTVLITTRDRELNDLARSDTLPDKLATATGGSRRTLAELPQLLREIEPRQRIERLERTWRLWDSPIVLGLLVVILSIEWVWRKLAGLV